MGLTGSISAGFTGLICVICYGFYMWSPLQVRSVHDLQARSVQHLRVRLRQVTETVLVKKEKLPPSN